MSVSSGDSSRTSESRSKVIGRGNNASNHRPSKALFQQCDQSPVAMRANDNAVGICVPLSWGSCGNTELRVKEGMGNVLGEAKAIRNHQGEPFKKMQGQLVSCLLTSLSYRKMPLIHSEMPKETLNRRIGDSLQAYSL